MPKTLRHYQALAFNRESLLTVVLCMAMASIVYASRYGLGTTDHTFSTGPAAMPSACHHDNEVYLVNALISMKSDVNSDNESIDRALEFVGRMHR